MFLTIPERLGKNYDVNVMSRSPWIVTIENFLSDTEVSQLSELLGAKIEVDGLKNKFGETGRLEAICSRDCDEVRQRIFTAFISISFMC